MTPYYNTKPATDRRVTARVIQVASPQVEPLPALPPAPEKPRPVVARKIQVLEHPLAQQALTTLRNKDTPNHQFRLTSNQLLVMLMLESTRSLPVREHTVETPTGAATGQALAKPVVFLTVARHGLGLAHSVADLFPTLIVGVISMDRSADGRVVEPRLHINNAPALGDACVILFDPVVASGGTVLASLNLVRRSGATDVALVTFVASLPGLSRLQSPFPDLRVWTAAIDPELDPKRGPLPGLGNFAERLYG